MMGATPGRFYFSTDTLPEEDRFPAFYEEIIRRYTPVDMVIRDQAPFRGSIELRRAGVVDIGLTATTPVNSFRSPELVRDGDDGLIVTLCRAGAVYQTQRSDDRQIEPGHGIISDCAYVGELNVLAETQFWHLKVPRHILTNMLPRGVALAGARLDKDSAALRLLFEYLGGTFDVDLNDDASAANLHEAHVVALIGMALGAEGEARLQAEQGGARAVRRAAILHEIDRHLGDPALSAALIGALLGITARYVHLLLEETGRSFTQHVLMKRLERTASMLRDPRYRDRKIAAIAFEAGFADLSHFNRAFRRRFGDTPSGMRTTLRSKS
jgi:AraC-like DNA-binding protein